MDITLPIQIHLFVVVPAIFLGLFNIVLKKGSLFHKANGLLWVVLMLLASISSFFIMPSGSLSWLHLFAIIVIFSVVSGVIAILQGNKRRHVRFMVGAYIGTVISAFFAVFVEGRLLNSIIF